MYKVSLCLINQLRLLLFQRSFDESFELNNGSFSMKLTLIVVNPFKHILTFFILCSLFFLINCNSNKKKIAYRDDSITAKTSFNNKFLDSIHLEKFIESQDSLKKYRDQFFQFYEQRNFEYAWFDTNGMTEQAHNFYNLQESLINNLNDSTLYNEGLQKQYEWLSENEQAKTGIYDSIVLMEEMQFTGQFFRYATKVYRGSTINAQELGWFIPRKKVNSTTLLDSLIDGVKKPFNEYEPLNIQYRLLEKYLIKYILLKKENAWKLIPNEKNFKKGDEHVVISNVKHRLFLLGDYNKPDTSLLFDTALVIVLKQFQRRFGLIENGRINLETIEKLNFSYDDIIKKILINMERARWMPPETANVDRVVVNIPDYKLNVYDSGKYSFSMPVVVGTAAHNTVIFSGYIRYIVFSPYWNVPTSITKNEVMPAMKRNKNYLNHNNMEITKYNGLIPEVRQKPGVNNALGKVKFLFPNKYNIYLHDTPFRDVFLDTKRTFSHGCIRIGNPTGLASFLLRRQPAFTADSIQSLMNQLKEKWVDAKPLVQVIVKYFTAWVDQNGQLNFREDIYGLDKRMADKLFD